MPVNIAPLVGNLSGAMKAGMVPPDTPEEMMPEINKKVDEMAAAMIQGLQPLIAFVDELEARLEALETQVVPEIQAINQQQDQSFEDFIAGDFGSLTSKLTGLEGDVGDLKTQAGLGAGNTPG